MLKTKKNTIGEINANGTAYVRGYTWKESISKYRQPQEHNSLYGNLTTEQFQNYMDNYYSPSEKYDFLVGDYNYTLTNAMKNEGMDVLKDKDGDVPGWYGICHGWSPAAYMEKRPVRTVTLVASDGKTKVNFLPDDIKAIITLFWSKYEFKTNFMGGRCNYNIDEVPSDPETGLWDDESCFSLNPASFVITLANQLGIQKRGLVVDPDSNGEIWNQPTFGYNMSYLNILRNLSTTDLSQAKVSIEELENSKGNSTVLKFLLRKCDKRTRSFVGINLKMDFIFELPPFHGVGNDANNIQHKKYFMIVELDENDNAIGGEWLENHHPIFAWTPDYHGEHTAYQEDTFVPTFNGTLAELQKMASIARSLSRKGTVLHSVASFLVERSAAPQGLEILE